MSVALVAVENVLIEQDGLRGKHPVPGAMRFVGALHGAYKVVLSSSAVDKEKLDYLLQINGIIQGRMFDSVLTREVQWKDLDEPDLRVAHFNNSRLNSGLVSLFVGGDPLSCAKIMYEGGNILLWQRAQYLRPDFRPDRPKPTAWAQLEEEAEHQVFLRREDERLNVKHEESEFLYEYE